MSGSIQVERNQMTINLTFLTGGMVVVSGTGYSRFSILREGFNLSALNFPIISIFLQNICILKLNSKL